MPFFAPFGRTKLSDQMFKAPLSFAGFPVSQDFADADIAVLGLPYDCGQHNNRVGARAGPSWIRQHSNLAEETCEDIAPPLMEGIHVIDAGDLNLTSVEYEDIEAFFNLAERGMDAIFKGGCSPVTMGGDGAVSLPQIRAASKHYPGLTVLHFDAHTDAYDVHGNNHFDNANTFTHAATEGLINVGASAHIGLRGILNVKNARAKAEQIGYRIIDVDQLLEASLDKCASMIREPLESLPIYLCFDLDFFDPAYAPGVCTPTPGGVSSHFGLSLLRRLSGLNIVACDINTMSPPHDPDGSTANLASFVMMECISLLKTARLN